MKITDLINSERNLASFSDKEIYHFCQEYGRGIKVLRRIFAVLLVEVFRRNLHRKYGFESIYEFGAKVGGMNRGLVKQILWLEKALRDKPCLWKAFIREGWSKVRVVANLATVRTDKFWAEKVFLLTKPALEVFVKSWNEKYRKCPSDFVKENLTKVGDNVADNFPKNSVKNADLLFPEPKSGVVQNLGEVVTDCEGYDNSIVKLLFNVTGETEFKFRLFKQKLGKKRKMAVTSGETLMELLLIAEKAGERRWGC